MRQFESQILDNRRISGDFFEMSLSWDAYAGAPRPGQFLTVRVTRGTVPLLRRPFAFAGFDERAGTVSIIYQTRGRGTEILAAKQQGETIDVMGPLGNTFPIEDIPQKAVAVAGGVGLGPIQFLVSALQARGVDAEFVFGSRCGSRIPNSRALKGPAARICTDDGSTGFAGNVVQYINDNIKLDNKTVICACGPAPMIKNLCQLARAAGSRIWVSLEAVMACGVGACVGCVVNTTKGFSRVCKEGPVFDGGEVIWEQT